MTELDLIAIDMMAEEAARIIREKNRVIHRLRCTVLGICIVAAGLAWYVVTQL
jgi:hypothetical protein